MRAALTVLAACACTTVTTLARSAPFELEWSAPEGCPSRERMVAASRARLGESESSAPPELFVRGNVSVEGAGAGAIVVDLRLKDAAGTDLGERRVRFVEPSCAAIEEPTAILLAMMIAVARPQDRAGEAAPQPGREAAAGPARESAVATSQEPAPKPASERSQARLLAPTQKQTRLPMTLGAAATASVGLLPNPGFGGALRWTATLAPLIMVGIEGSFETSWAVRAASGEAMFRFLDAGPFVGVRILRSRWFEVVPLFEARAGLLAGSTTGFRTPYDVTRFLGVVGAGVLGRARLGPSLHLEVLPDLRMPLARNDFQVRDRGELVHVHRPAAIEARLSVGIAWEVP